MQGPESATSRASQVALGGDLFATLEPKNLGMNLARRILRPSNLSSFDPLGGSGEGVFHSRRPPAVRAFRPLSLKQRVAQRVVRSVAQLVAHPRVSQVAPNIHAAQEA